MNIRPPADARWRKRRWSAAAARLPGPAGRFSYADAPPSPWNPLTWVLALFDEVDRLNDRAEGCRTCVNIALKARRP